MMLVAYQLATAALLIHLIVSNRDHEHLYTMYLDLCTKYEELLYQHLELITRDRRQRPKSIAADGPQTPSVNTSVNTDECDAPVNPSTTTN